MSLISTCIDSLTKIISPPFCIGCEDLLPDYTVMCVACLDRLPKIFSYRHVISPARAMTVHAFTAYQAPLDRLIQAKLNSQSTPIFQLSYLLSAYAKTRALECDLVVPIPLHWQRSLSRGFNQATLLAQGVGRALEKPVVELLVRNKNTPFQSTLARNERAENVRNIFTVNTKYLGMIKNKRILLIDDLYTTGATAGAAALELYKQGACSVELLVACKVTE
jgi:competence protein ComFC